MFLDLEDVNIRARLSRVSDQRIRLVLEYPRTQSYRDKVMRALADLLHPHQDRVLSGSAKRDPEMSAGDERD